MNKYEDMWLSISKYGLYFTRCFPFFLINLLVLMCSS